MKVDASALAERFAAIVQAKEAERSEVTKLKLKVTALEKQADSLRQQADIAGVIRKAMAGDAPASDVTVALEEARQELATANGRAEALEVELSKAREGEDRTLRGARLLTEGLQLLVGTGAAIDAHFDIDELASKVAARLPHGPTTVVLKPTEALRKDYLEREAQRLADDIRSLMPRQRDLLLWLWQHADYTTLKNWIVRVTGQESLTGGGGYKQVREEIQGLIDRRLVTTDSHGFQVAIGVRVATDLSDYKATSAELEAVLNRALSILQQREGTV